MNVILHDTLQTIANHIRLLFWNAVSKFSTHICVRHISLHSLSLSLSNFLYSQRLLAHVMPRLWVCVFLFGALETVATFDYFVCVNVASLILSFSLRCMNCRMQNAFCQCSSKHQNRCCGTRCCGIVAAN